MRKKQTINRAKARRLQQLAVARQFRVFVAGYVINAYLNDDENPITEQRLIQAFVSEMFGDARNAGLILDMVEALAGDAMKKGIKMALKDGVPGVLVTQAFFDATEEELAAVDSCESARPYVAGMGKGSASAGVLLVYEDDQEANWFWMVAHDHRCKVANGLHERVANEVEAAVQQKLPGNHPNSKRVKAIRNMPDVPLLGDE